ncbi:MAG: Urease accessory protein UreF [uncultured Acetobacteraceae bacterium]|uniref:Urease accessory protein UreF n=1 Tax=uncultured Acetobacteraceae bacterium TaxID=169975 RepID=A0A6J4JLD4_9PROT|nr:MAG: Urease accessory protein UreF [uncultured Acetobacteraceae bacterium]
MATIITIEPAALYRLLAWLSPAYPVGGFSYSHGLEAAVEAGSVRDRAGLVGYVAAVLRAGTGRVDGALLAAAWRAAQDGDGPALDDAAALAAAWRGTAETALESLQQGAAFAAVTQAAWPEAHLAAFAARHPRRLSAAVAFGAAAGFHGVPLRPALAGWLGAFAANLVSAGVRLVPLGQTDGQIATAALHPVIEAAADVALVADLDRLGTATPTIDLLSMRHETQYTRLFRS